jgi:hypothetical protein
MCLTDGEIYIGAVFNAPKFFDLENYYVVRITAQYYDRTKPMYFFLHLEQLKQCKLYPNLIEN